MQGRGFQSISISGYPYQDFEGIQSVFQSKIPDTFLSLVMFHQVELASLANNHRTYFVSLLC